MFRFAAHILDGFWTLKDKLHADQQKYDPAEDLKSCKLGLQQVFKNKIAKKSKANINSRTDQTCTIEHPSEVTEVHFLNEVD